MTAPLSVTSRVHQICKLIRENTWAGIDEAKAVCHECPRSEDTAYGKGTRGCYLLAEQCFNVAVVGDKLGRV